MSRRSNSLPKRIKKLIRGILNYGIPLKIVVILCALFAAAAIGITYYKVLDKVGGKDEYDEAMRYIYIKDIVCDNYIGEADRDAMADSASAAIVAGLNDKWSYYMSADEYRTYQLYSSGEYSTIGMAFSKDDSGGFMVDSVNYDSAAARAGLTAGMIIKSVDGTDVRNMNVDEVRTLIRSKMNSEFVLGFVRGDPITIDCSISYVSSVTYRLEKTMAGYIQISDFEAGTAQDAIDAIEVLLDQGAVAFVLDLRGNTGGLYSEARDLLDHLLPNYDLYIEVDKAGHEKVYSSDALSIDVPMCVLVNSGTYGCAEMFAAIMQEYSWATILGEQTTGNIQSQDTFDLEDGSAIHLSTKTYLTGYLRTDISNIGVTPDVITYNEDESATGTTQGTLEGAEGTSSVSDDTQLMQALKLLSKGSQ